MSNRDTNKYTLNKGNKVVYVGITDDPGRREAEHRQDKDFDKMVIVGNKTTRSAAEKWESDRIQTYKDNHKGQTPKYNKNDSGK